MIARASEDISSRVERSPYCSSPASWSRGSSLRDAGYGLISHRACAHAEPVFSHTTSPPSKGAYAGDAGEHR